MVLVNIVHCNHDGHKRGQEKELKSIHRKEDVVRSLTDALRGLSKTNHSLKLITLQVQHVLHHIVGDADDFGVGLEVSLSRHQIDELIGDIGRRTLE